MFLAFVCVLGCNNGTTTFKDINYYIPNGYKGVVVIVFEEKVKTVSNEFKIPENGILYSPNMRNKGVFIPRYFYVDSNGDKIQKIEEIERYAIKKYRNALKEDTSYVLDAYDGKFNVKPKNEINNSNTYSTKDWKTIKWVYFTIGNDEIERADLRGKANKIIDSLQNEIGKRYQ